MSLEHAYASVARAAGFVESGHDAAYEGTLGGVSVRFDNGIRASGCYKVELRVGIATAERRGCVDDGETSPLRAALHALREDEGAHVCAVRVDDGAVVVRLLPQTSPRYVIEIAQRVIALCRQAAETGPYR